ncbi:hypothetical protein BXZ70DRAFT_544462 [Cristinia sonorae]|uniref:Uncharacterized protein n=1 Tax=Cristinia sonorae TaxID=1940300 RepID=A0A8K0UG24_9AGAR|nr:hypothetical protein BXZ70DRAFT_544462 [Cristinia sonorae]
MSSPIAFTRPQAPAAVDTTISSSASSTSSLAGKYIPVHKRGGATPPSDAPPSSSRSPSPSRPKRHRHRKSAIADYEHNHQDTPIHTSIPNIYSISDLLSLSSSPAPLTPTQLANLQELVPFTYSPPAVALTQSQQQRRRRNNRVGKSTKPPRPLVTAPEELHEHRRKHNWGWHPTTHVEDTWRHAPAPVAVQ